jgi:hypothetical protein
MTREQALRRNHMSTEYDAAMEVKAGLDSLDQTISCMSEDIERIADALTRIAAFLERKEITS